MRVDGKHIAEDIRAQVHDTLLRTQKRLSLGVLMVGENAVTQQFVHIKKKAADEIGVAVVERVLSEKASTEDVVQEIEKLIVETSGIIVQLPLPKHIDRERIFDAIPASHDVDCLGREAHAAFEKGGTPLLPPVVAACKEILERYSISLADARAVVVGKGVLVGAPAAHWLTQQGALVRTLEDGDTISEYTKDADIIVLGAGHPHLIKPDMIKGGVVILDAGTSESEGKVVGDADPSCAEKAALLTPVPGGIGPVAVAKIFENLLVCNSVPL